MILLKISVFGLLILLFGVPGGARASGAAADGLSYYAENDSLTRSVRGRIADLSPIEADEVTWLARCIYSESDRPHEQELVAWVVRNRVETGYRGATYRGVVLQGKQFSAFNTPTKRRGHILSLDHQSPSRAWQRALQIALKVYKAPAGSRPFARTVRHFYSPVSMQGGRTPHWALGEIPLSSTRLGVDPNRFLFFDGLEEGLDVAEEDAAPRQESGIARRGNGGSGLMIMRPSGKVSRPKRPSVTPPQTGGR